MKWDGNTAGDPEVEPPPPENMQLFQELLARCVCPPHCPQHLSAFKGLDSGALC